MIIAIIGAGNMGGAIARGIASTGEHTVILADPSDEALRPFTTGPQPFDTTHDNARAAGGADMIVVAVKPWIAEDVFRQIGATSNIGGKSVVSIVAGLTFARMREAMGEETAALFRVIPNTAVSFGESFTFIAHEGASARQTDAVAGIFGSLGKTMIVNEQQMIAGTALASCGIAYALKYIDASMKAGVELGFSRPDALAIVRQTVRGALRLLEENRSLPQTEIDKVTTPGGITLKGLKVLEDRAFDTIVADCLKAAR